MGLEVAPRERRPGRSTKYRPSWLHQPENMHMEPLAIALVTALVAAILLLVQS